MINDRNTLGIVFDYTRLTSRFAFSQKTNALRLETLFAMMGQRAKVLPVSNAIAVREFLPGLLINGVNEYWRRNYFDLGRRARNLLSRELGHLRASPETPVIGWELPPAMKAFLADTGLRYVDFRLSPLRFLEKAGLDITSNSDEVADWFSPRYVPLDEDKRFAAVRDRVAKMAPTEERTLVIVGQTPFDASIFDPVIGFDSLLNHADELIEISRQYDRVIYRGHPRGSAVSIGDLKRLIPHVEPDTQTSVYAYFRHGTGFCALSSSVLEEARFFGLPYHRLVRGAPLIAGCDTHRWANCDIDRSFDIVLTHGPKRIGIPVTRTLFPDLGGAQAFDFTVA